MDESYDAVQVFRYDAANSADAWDQRYTGMTQVWSGQPNTALVTKPAD